MHTDIFIDEVTKGVLYRQEPERVKIISENEVHFSGRHTIHNLHKKGETWVCDCAAYRATALLPTPAFCRHTIATERVANTPSLLKRMSSYENSSSAMALVAA